MKNFDCCLKTEGEASNRKGAPYEKSKRARDGERNEDCPEEVLGRHMSRKQNRDRKKRVFKKQIIALVMVLIIVTGGVGLLAVIEVDTEIKTGDSQEFERGRETIFSSDMYGSNESSGLSPRVPLTYE